MKKKKYEENLKNILLGKMVKELVELLDKFDIKIDETKGNKGYVTLIKKHKGKKKKGDKHD